MTGNSVAISITIRVSEREVKIENEIGISDMEETIQGMVVEAGQQVFGMGRWCHDHKSSQDLTSRVEAGCRDRAGAPECG